MNADEAAIGEVLDQWASATRDGREEEVLANHLEELVIFDVLAPLQYTSAAQYRASWADQNNVCCLKSVGINPVFRIQFGHSI